MIAPRYAAVVLPVPVNRSYIYEVPEALAARVVPGARVVVPLQRRSVVGIVTELDGGGGGVDGGGRGRGGGEPPAAGGRGDQGARRGARRGAGDLAGAARTGEMDV